MKASTTLISRAAVLAGVIIGLSAQSVSAHSVESASDRGRSCWAHSRHKTHKHSVGHDHGRCHDHDDDHDDDRDHDHDDDRTDDRDAPSTPSTSVPATGGESGGSAGSGEGRATDPVVTTTSVPSGDSAPATPRESTEPVTGPEAESPTDSVTSRRPSSPRVADDRPVSVIPVGGGIEVESPVSAPVSTPEAGFPLVSVGDATQAAAAGSAPVIAASVGGTGVVSLWWLLMLVVVALVVFESYRRWRSTRA